MSGWIRVPAKRGDDVAAGVLAGALAAGVGLVAFYLIRTFLAREPLSPPGPMGSDSAGEGGERG